MVENPVGNAYLRVRVYMEDILIYNLQEHDQNYQLTLCAFLCSDPRIVSKNNELLGSLKIEDFY